MTKNDYVKMLMRHDNIDPVSAERMINFYVEAGMLKVDKENKSEYERSQDIAEKVFKAWMDYGVGKFGCSCLIKLLDKAGLKIVEK